MSVVTGLILICDLGDGEDCINDAETPTSNIRRLNDWLNQHGFRPLVNLADKAGGSKHPQCCTFHCGYNYFPQDEFAEFVLSLPWDEPENVVLVMQPEEGPTRVFRPQ